MATSTTIADYKKSLKQWKKGKRRAKRPTKIPAVLCAILAVIFGILLTLVHLFDQTFYVLTGSSYHKINQGAESAGIDSEYYKSSFSSDEERRAYGAELNERLEEEGAVLLLNKDNTLPLAQGSVVSCFTQAAANPVYGGTGSGAVDASTAATLKDGLENASFVVNPTLWDFYTEGEGSKYRRTNVSHRGTGVYALNEIPWAVYPQETVDSIADYGDAAIFVVGRVGGEGADLPKDDCVDALDGNILTLNAEEREVLAQLTAMKQAGSIDKIVVLINSANALQLDFLTDSAYSVDACLWVGDMGPTGMNAIGRILSGEVTPSGHLADTYCYDNLTSPAVQNYGSYTYTNADTVTLDAVKDDATQYIVYQEGIYVGYRYYETRYEDTVMNTGNTAGYDYHADVAYPFGFGLSYTTFAYSDFSAEYRADKDEFSVSVNVTNTGDTYSGKQVVEIYAQSPYTTYDKENGVEKASAVLCGFAKTGTLAPGQSETVQITVPRKELASYDAYGAKTYILEDGTYYLTAAADAHEAVNNFLAAKGYTPAETDNRMDSVGNAEMVYAYENPAFDAVTYSVSENGTAITNQFENADLNLYDNGAQSISYLSRSDWTGTFPTAADTLEITAQMAADLADSRYEDGEGTETAEPVDSGLKLIELRGADFDDPRWDTLLNELSYDEMAYLVGHGFHLTMPAESVSLPGTHDENGPQGLTGSLLKGELDSSAFTSEDVMAATWNIDLLAEVGRCIGEDCLANGYSGLYGPGNNIHRTPYSGRNFEYYSEDGFLSGQMSYAENAAILDTGTYVMLKHCVLNDGETDREGLGTWANEQSIREVYLKAFELPMTKLDRAGVMTSYSRIGCTWNGAHSGLLRGVLRGEWGNHGIFISDNTGFHEYMDGVDGTLAGSTLYDAMAGMQYRDFLANRGNAALTAALREACHYNLYCIVNSSAMNGITVYDTIKTVYPAWRMALNIIVFAAAGLFVLFTVLTIRRGKAYKKANPKPVKPEKL